MQAETVTIPGGTIRARSLRAGVWFPGDWMPSGTYEIIRRANSVFHALMPSGQEQTHIGTYYYPLSEKWNSHLKNAKS